MTKQNSSKLKRILEMIPNNSLVTTQWLKKQGISNTLLHFYTNSGWLSAVSVGVYKKLSDDFDMDGAIYALQSQLNLAIHIGALSSLSEKYNLSQNIMFNYKTVLFGLKKEKLPKWFKTIFKNKYDIFFTDFLPENLGIEIYNNKSFTTKISSMERAILEVLYLVPNAITIQTAYQTMEMLSSLRPNLLQKLLENTNSIKVKRLFLYMAEKCNYPWFEKLNLKRINLGKGIRKITSKGKFDKKYKIVIGNVEQ